MGVFLKYIAYVTPGESLPHARGGVSHPRYCHCPRGWSSPRPWGCFHGCLSGACPAAVFPTPVGVFLRKLYFCFASKSLPHARGGVSVGLVGRSPDSGSSPRPWGCFLSDPAADPADPVFPTPVGVFLANKSSNILSIRLPHARGGVSGAALTTAGQKLSSPRPWGCFCYSYLEDVMEIVFPTPVGVFLTGLLFFLGLLSLPHARGGVSEL